MLSKPTLRVLTSAILLAFLPGCAWFPHAASSPLAGAWTNRIGTVWTIKNDGTFDVDLTRSGKRDTWGRYTIAGNTITISDLNPKMPKECQGEGVYHFKRNGTELSFTLVHDSCKLRKKNVLLSWRLKK